MVLPHPPVPLCCSLQGKRFQMVDATWRATMRRALEDPKALHAMRQPGLLTRLTEANTLLDLIQKGLNAYGARAPLALRSLPPTLSLQL